MQLDLFSSEAVSNHINKGQPFKLQACTYSVSTRYLRVHKYKYVPSTYGVRSGYLVIFTA